MKNRNLHKAKRVKNDEFYTRLEDIEKEVANYRSHFKGKVVFCPCDDPFESQFFQYFSKSFERLGLKKLITACYKSTDLFTQSKKLEEDAIWLEYIGDKNGNRVPDPEEIGVHRFKGDGDFRSKESIALLRQADIVVTNPPFSLFREFVSLLLEEDKKFLIIGSNNAITCKEIFPHIKEKRLWLGREKLNKFDTPDGEKSVLAYWYTNMQHSRRNEPVVCYKKYTPSEYPVYDNYDAIDVSNVKDIPECYEGVMGVPITFLEKHDPEQFDILGITASWDKCSGVKTGGYGRKHNPYLNGESKYRRILIRHSQSKENTP